MSFSNFTSGKSHSFGGDYLELVPHERLRWTDRFNDPNLPGEMKVIRKALPQAAESISYRIPTCKLNGRPVIHFGGFRAH
jgi:uncharacterized protein YdhG (YjbR/CyaY superfamily)